MTTPPGPALLQADQVSLRRGGVAVLRAVSVRVCAGQSTAIVGANGAGKSSLLGLLAGLHAPESGQISLAGQPLAHYSPAQRARHIAWLGQHTELDAALSVYDLVMLGRLPHLGPWGAASAADHAAVARALHDTTITALAARRVASLSGGQRQQVLIARALATEAPLLLLDEPTTHLDAPHQRALRAALATRQQQGAAVVTVVHDLNHALRADQLLLMDQGQITLSGPPQDPALRAALCAAFDHAITLIEIAHPSPPRWIAVPSA